VSCSVLQCVAMTYVSRSRHDVVPCVNDVGVELLTVAVRCIVLQHLAVCCNDVRKQEQEQTRHAVMGRLRIVGSLKL